jgi:hypothetical protein
MRVLLFLGLTLISVAGNAQCAMCRAQISNNVTPADTAFAEGLNLGILYLFFAPYVVFGTVIFFWFRMSKRNETSVSAE